MDELEKRIAGNLFDLKQHTESPFDLKNFLELSDNQLETCFEKLTTSAEKGITEYKTQIILKTFRLLDSFNYDTSRLSELGNALSETISMTYVILLQLMISKKQITINKEEEPEEEPEEKTLAQINAELNDMLAGDKKLKNNKLVQNMVLTLNLYKKELENMKKMLPNIPAERRTVFKNNFQKSFSNMSESVIENYKQFQKELRKDYTGSIIRSLSDYDLTSITEIYKKQAELASKMSSIISFAVQEKYKIREILKNLAGADKTMLKLIEEEEHKYYSFSLSESEAVQIEKLFAAETAKIVKKQKDS